VSTVYQQFLLIVRIDLLKFSKFKTNNICWCPVRFICAIYGEDSVIYVDSAWKAQEYWNPQFWKCITDPKPRLQTLL